MGEGKLFETVMVTKGYTQGKKHFKSEFSLDWPFRKQLQKFVESGKFAAFEVAALGCIHSVGIYMSVELVLYVYVDQDLLVTVRHKRFWFPTA